MSGQIFISYRRDDNPAWARSLYDRLTQRFGENQVFRDVDGIPLGKDFLKEIERRVGECDVLIAVIGERWLHLHGSARGQATRESERFRTDGDWDGTQTGYSSHPCSGRWCLDA